MGRKRSANVEEKRKAVKVRPIERKHAGKVVEAYRLVEELVKAHHPELEPAKIILLWRKGWKPDVDKVLTLARIKRASELDHAIAAMIGDGYDFAVQLNEEAWPGLSEAKRRQVIDHELCHGAPDLDRDGKQKIDSKERLCWRARKHPIQEFPEIIERYGVEQCLGLNDQALKAVEDADRPLLKAAEQAGAAEPVAAGYWRGWPFEALQKRNPAVTDRQIKALEASTLFNLGELAELMDRKPASWHRDVNGIGKDTKAAIEDALGVIRAA